MVLNNENEVYAQNLCGHLNQMAHRLRQIPPEKWDWAPDPAAPTARILARHAWQWLICDRQHIAEPNALKHEAIPEPADDPQVLCDALQAETNRWRGMILSLSPEQLAEPRRQFNGHEMNVRGFIAHMLQNCIYKNGQLATLYFALQLDGKEPYDAPFPNPIYAALRQYSALQSERAGEGYEDFARAFAKEAIPGPILRHTYDAISSNAGGISVRATDSLEEVYHYRSQGIPIKVVIEYLARQSGRAITGDLGSLPPIETVADLVHAVVNLTTPDSENANET